MAPKRVLKCLSLEEKFKLIKEVESGSKRKKVAEKYGIPASTISTILKKRELIMTALESGTSSGCSKRTKKPIFEKIDKTVLGWFVAARNQNLPISDGILKEKAMEFAKRFGDDNFKASTGWLNKWKQRHDVNHKRKGGESDDAQFPTDDDYIEDYSSEFMETILIETESDNEGSVEEIRHQPPMNEVEGAFKTLALYLQTSSTTTDDHYKALNKLESFYIENNKKKINEIQ